MLYKFQDSPDFAVMTSTDVLLNTDAPTTETRFLMMVMRKTSQADFVAVAPLPPLLIFGFDSSTGNGWTAGTLSLRVWVLE